MDSSAMAIPDLSPDSTRDHFSGLPTELIDQIFRHVADFDANPPSVIKFSAEPSPDLTSNSDHPIKDLSRVCHRWRAMVIPELFKYARILLSPKARWLRLCGDLTDHLECRVRFFGGLRNGQNRSRVNAMMKSLGDGTLGFEYIADGDKSLMSIQESFRHWMPCLRGNAARFIDFMESSGLQSKVKSLVVYTQRSLTSLRAPCLETTIIARETVALWQALLQCVDPPRLVIAAPPITLAFLLCSKDGWNDEGEFEMPLHYVCFTIPSLPKAKQKMDASSSQPNLLGSIGQNHIYNMRPWTKLAYNEGTMIGASFHDRPGERFPPQVLAKFLYWIYKKEKRSPLGPRLQSFEYISLFPSADHVNWIFKTLADLKELRQVHVKFANRSLLEDAEVLGRARVGELEERWMQSYVNIVSAFLARPASAGTVLIIEDAATSSRYKKTILSRMPTRALVNGKWQTVVRVENDPFRYVRLVDE